MLGLVSYLVFFVVVGLMMRLASRSGRREREDIAATVLGRVRPAALKANAAAPRAAETEMQVLLGQAECSAARFVADVIKALQVLLPGSSVLRTTCPQGQYGGRP